MLKQLFCTWAPPAAETTALVALVSAIHMLDILQTDVPAKCRMPMTTVSALTGSICFCHLK